MDKKKIVKEIQSLLTMKLKYFKMFYNISAQQKKNAHSRNNLEIETLLLKKDKIISKIKEFETRIEFLFKNNSSMESLLLGDREIKSLDNQVIELIKKIVPVEKEVAKILEKDKNLLKENISTIRRGKTLISGYGGVKFTKPRFVDYKLE